MAVFTAVSYAEAEALLDLHFDVGTLIDFQGIADGVENSNFFVTTDRAQFVLTLFERVADHDVPYFMALTEYLRDNDVHCGRPIRAKDGSLHRRFKGKQSALIERLNGASVQSKELSHVTQVGAELGRFHRASVNFPRSRANSFGVDWMSTTLAKVSDKIGEDIVVVARQELQSARSHMDDPLTRGTVHGDLFHDNVLFDNGMISGLIDFYYACSDVLIYDLAIVINDWCFNQDGTRNDAFTDAMLGAYQAERELSQAESDALAPMCRRAAFRFWLSRQHDASFPRDASMVTIKDPTQFYRILEFHRHEQGIRLP